MNCAVRRVAFVSPAWPPEASANGIVTYVHQMRMGLREHGVESGVATCNRLLGNEEATLISGALSQRNMVARLATRLATRLAPRLAHRYVPTLDVMVGLRRLERLWPFDILETEETFGIAKWIARGISAPVVIRLHGPWVVNGPMLGVPRDATFHDRVAAEREAIASAVAVTAPCLNVISLVRSAYNLRLPNAIVIPNPGPEPKSDNFWIREAAELNHVLFVGRFDRLKGGDVMVDAFSLLADRMPLLRLTIAGPDDGVVDESGRRWSFPEYLTAKVPASHRDRIEFLGRMSPDVLVKLRRRASVVICASRHENFPMAVLEALSQGCPVVVPEVGGLPEMVEDGISGLTYPVGDARALSQRIELLIREPSRAAQLGEAALKQYQVNYLPRRVAERTLDFYRDVCAQHTMKSRSRP